MSDKKHIDRLFQEKFKEFEATPDTDVWNNIQSNIESKRKKRRIIPIWWKFAGVAAVLLILFTIGNSIYKSSSNNSGDLEQIIVDTDTDTKTESNANVIDSQNSSIISNNNNDLTTNIDDVKLNENEADSSINNESSYQQNNNPTKNKSRVISQSNKNRNNSITSIKKKTTIKNTLNSVSNSNNTVTSTTNKKFKNNNSNKSLNTIDKKSNDELVKKAINNSTNAVTETQINEDNSIKELNTLEELKKEAQKEEGTLSIEEELAETNNEEDIIEKEELKNRWNVMPNIAPVYFNTLGKGSSIDAQFANNDKSGTLNMSYGIAASYDVSNKLTVRTGVNRVNVGYNTNDVIIYQGIETPDSPDNRPIRSINYNENAQNTVIISADNFEFSQVPNILTNTIDASLDQRLGFIEVPLELAYKVSDKKLGFSVIGGFSALFLSENEIYSTLNGNSTLLGEANNINKTSFSANFGLGLDYKLSNKFNINLEPVFKYQMNTFKDTSGDFQPFIIGVYTGFSFKF